MKIWDLKQPGEILRVLKSIPQEDIGIIKQISSASEVSFQLTTFRVREERFYLESILPLDFNPSLPLIQEINHLGARLVLEPGSWNVEDKGILCDIPSKIRVTERRIHKRYKFKNGEVYLTLRAYRGKTVKEIRARVDNVSAHGLGLVFQSSEEFFFQSSLFEIVAVNGIPYQERNQLMPKHVHFHADKCIVGLFCEEGLSKAFLRELSSPLRSEVADDELKLLTDEFYDLVG